MPKKLEKCDTMRTMKNKFCEFLSNLQKDCFNLLGDVAKHPLEFLVFGSVLAFGLVTVAISNWANSAIFVAAWVGAFFAYRRAQAVEKGLRKTEESRLNERFGRFCEMLGHNKAVVQIGGLIGLDNLAQTQSKKYKKNVFDIACAFIRDNSTADKPRQQAIDLFLKSRTDDADHFYNGITADLTKSNLESMDMTKAFLSGAILVQSRFKGHALDEAILDGANLSKANVFSSTLLRTKSIKGAIIPKDACTGLGDVFVIANNIQEGENP